METKLKLPALALLTLSFQLSTAHARGMAFTYQGHLNDGGTPANGSYDMAFTLFATNTSGIAIAGPLTNLATSVSNGSFNVTLDFGGAVFTGNNAWLEIGVQTNGGSGYVTLTPRQPILPVPYAIFANSASNLLGTLSAAQLGAGTAGINISGNAATATTATTFTNPVADAQLSANIPRLNSTNVFTGTITFISAVIATNPANQFGGTFTSNGGGLTSVSVSQLDGTLPLTGWINVHTQYGADNTGVTDCTASVQAAITAACPTNSYSANVLYFPPGIYRFSSPPSGSANSVLTVPYHYATIAPRGPCSTITLRGASFAGNISGSLSGQGDGGLPMGTNGTTFLITTTNKGGFFRSLYVGGNSTMIPLVKDITFVAPANGNIVVLDFSNFRGCSVEGCGFNVGIGHKNLLNQPSTNLVAIKCYPSALSGLQRYRNVDIDGYGIGLIFSEHTTASMIDINGCYIGMQGDGGGHVSVFHNVIEADNTIMLNGGVGADLLMEGWDMEESTSGPVWMQTQWVVNDPNNVLNGTAWYSINMEGGGTPTAFNRFNGCAYFKAYPVGGLSGVSTTMVNGQDTVSAPSIYLGLGYPSVTYRSMNGTQGALRVYEGSTNGSFSVQSTSTNDNNWYYWKFSP